MNFNQPLYAWNTKATHNGFGMNAPICNSNKAYYNPKADLPSNFTVSTACPS